MKSLIQRTSMVVAIGLVSTVMAGAQALPAPTPSATSESRSHSGASSDYVVGAQDVLKITVFDEPSLTGTYRVDPDGSFQYPMLGRIAAGGKRVRDIEQLLRGKLEDGYIKRAQVVVDVDEFRSRSIFIVGEVRSPGKYPITGEMSLIEALAAAGSTTSSAGSEVLVLHSRNTTAAQVVLPDQADDPNVRRINLTDLQLGRLDENVALMEGDTVFVPKAERFFVTGQVKNPGAYTYDRGLTVLQAISLAGGLTDKGSNRRLKVIRTLNGKKTEQGIDLYDAIQPGDTLVIPQRLL
jgi:polysaccharide export outer membrane protein